MFPSHDPTAEQEGFFQGCTWDVLDGGQGRLHVVDYMGNDQAITDAARVSYGNTNQKTPEENEKLINYLMKHEHTSPFEMCELKVYVKCPIFVARQWMRHRTGSFNEISRRYTSKNLDYYLPQDYRLQSTSNKQVGQADLPVDAALAATQYWDDALTNGKKFYRAALESGVCREQARGLLPQVTMTEFYWKVDLHNLFNFIRLRSSP